MKEKKKSSNKRSIASMFALVSFGYLAPSGVLMHFGIKNGNELFSHITMGIHWIASIIFLISVVTHLVLNWNSIKRYIFKEPRNISGYKKEFIIALLVTTILVLIIGSHPLRIQ